MIGLFHTRAQGSACAQYNNVPGDNAAGLDRLDDRRLRGEDFGGAHFAIHLILAHHARVNRGALDDTATRSEIALRKADGGGEPALRRRIRRHDHVVGIDVIALPQYIP